MSTYNLFFNIRQSNNSLISLPVTLIEEGSRYFIKAPYNKSLINEIKCMEGAKWHGYDENNPRKMWSVAISNHNLFQINYLTGQNPYKIYDTPLDYSLINTTRPLYNHQKEMLAHMLTRRQCIVAAEMGCGKSLSAIEMIEHIYDNKINNFQEESKALRQNGAIWVAPRSALYSVQLELAKWRVPSYINNRYTLKLLTYEGLKKSLEDWPKDKKPPFIIIFDESSRIKNHTAQRSQAAQYLADQMRLEHNQSQPYIILMSGSPAPKSPLDWFSQCRVARPGFIKEGSLPKFRDRLAVVEQKEAFPGGGAYPSLVTWRDDERKCEKCGLFADDYIHTMGAVIGEGHSFHPSRNEVGYLYERMKGLTLVILKKDCLDLPDKIYKIIKVEPTQAIKNMAKIIGAKAKTSIEKLTLLRELSDGFQYQDDNTKQVSTPKEQALIDLLDEHSDNNPPRIVIYAGFTGSIDRCVDIVKKQDWQYIRADGRGWQSSFNSDNNDKNLINPANLLEIFQDRNNHDRIAFIGQPGAAGLGITLTASPTIVYYSNDWNFESRIQSEDRIHRIGMDTNKGATIIDIIHLETDQFILENLKKKKKLQDLTLGEIPDVY